MKLKILHVSDLHFTGNDIIQDIVVTSLSQKIEQLCRSEPPPNLLMLTGDVAFSGKPEEYAHAKQFIDRIAGFCGIKSDRIFIIPGNHDVDRSKIKPEYITWWYKFRDEKELNQTLGSAVSFPLIRNTTGAYYDFFKSYMNGSIRVGEYGEYVVEVPLDDGGLKLSIIGLNSALFCGYDGDEKQQLALGLPQVSACYTNVDEKSIVITCVHHPFECFHYCEKPSLNTVQRNSDIILSGHVHDPANSFRRDGTAGETVFISAGAAYEKRTSQNGFNVIELDTQDLKGRAVAYKYLPDKHIWVLNTDINHETGGLFEFQIKKQGFPVVNSVRVINVADAVSIPPSISTHIPTPPETYARPPYIGSHQFVGREAELNTLNDWSKAANPYPVLLFEAMGGTGKSMLTWEWVTKYARIARDDWKGIFWYSFYVKGAVMADFCQRALAYMTSISLQEFQKMKTPELGELLIPELNKGPWLIILDGLERVLKDYDHNRFAEDHPTKPPQIDKGGKGWHPCSCTNDEDDELLQMLSSVHTSKILASSRLVPRTFLNIANQPIPGVQRFLLPGLRPVDAEAMFRSCGITGDSEAIQNYLVNNCGCHPLTMGALAGLISDYMPDRGNFNEWVDDSSGAGKLNFANLDLVAKQKHILNVAMSVLSQESRQLLSTMSLLYEAVDYDTLWALNPHMPSGPEKVEEPENPEKQSYWDRLSPISKDARLRLYAESMKEWKQYKENLERWLNSDEYSNAAAELEKTIRDLELRGLIQYDYQTRRFELHPVVRLVASGGLSLQETKQYGQKVVDYFMSKTHNPYENAKTLEDVSDGLHIVRTLLRMGRYADAWDNYQGELENSLYVNLEAYRLVKTLIKPFFPNGWTALPLGLDSHSGIVLANNIAVLLQETQELQESLPILEFLIPLQIAAGDVGALKVRIRNVACIYMDWGAYATEKRILDYSTQLTEFVDIQPSRWIFLDRLRSLSFYSRVGNWDMAEEMWKLLDPMGRVWNIDTYRAGEAECAYAILQFRKGLLNQKIIDNAMQIAREGNTRATIRDLYRLQGQWQLAQQSWEPAMQSFSEAVRLARAIGVVDSTAEVYLALAKFHQGLITNPVEHGEYLSGLSDKPYLALAELWCAMRVSDRGIEYARQAYNSAWGDGEPFVNRYELDKATHLLKQLGADIPQLPAYDPNKDVKRPWEAGMIEFIEKLKAEKNKTIEE